MGSMSVLRFWRSFYKVDYEELVEECGLGDEAGAMILVSQVTN